MAKISIIVPIYNAEKYLYRCLDSIKDQTYRDWECILVDDGSIDESGKICDEYTQKDNRFNVIHKANEGVSKARQTGLDVAIGEYVIHADPDDWVESNWLLALLEKAETSGADMVICDFERIFAHKSVVYHQKPTTLKNEDILVDFLSEKVWGPCWNKLIRRKCFLDYNISFHPLMNLWEDLYVMCLLVSKGVKVEYVPKTLYHYDSVININGIVMHRTDNHIRSVLIFINDLSPILSSKIYEDGWFHVKSKMKEWIFMVKSSQLDIRETCGEINGRYIKESKVHPFWAKERCIALCLKGYPALGYFLYNISKRISACKRFQ